LGHASIFKDVFPTINPDVISFVIDMTYMTARLAKGLRQKRMKRTAFLRARTNSGYAVTEFWYAKICDLRQRSRWTAEPCCYQPIMLGDRLPQHIIDKVAERLTRKETSSARSACHTRFLRVRSATT
jgi:hypothetical protein